MPREDEEIINNMLREFKGDFKINIVQLKSNNAVKSQSIEIKTPETIKEIDENYISIPLIGNDKFYEDHKKQRNERVFKKFEGVER